MNANQSIRPQPADLREMLVKAQEICTGADQILLQGFGAVTAREKSDGSLVTEIDQAVDLFVTNSIASAYPEHAILSEEANTRYDPECRYTWIIDPLDGTTNFARGLPIWGVSIGLLSYGVPVLGVLSFSLLHENFSSTIGGGAFLNGTRIHTASAVRADTHNFIMLCSRTPRRYRVETPLKARMFGATAYHLAAVARGTAFAAVEATPKIWDIAAVLLILTEAGGCYRALDPSQEIFPLQGVDADYKQRSFPLVASANLGILSELEDKIVGFQ